MYQEKIERHRRKKKQIITGILAMVVVLAAAVTIFFTVYISSYTVTGNIYVEEQEIIDEIFGTPMEQRFFYSYFRNLLHRNRDVRFLSSYKLHFSPNLSVTVEVTENAIAGAVSWEGRQYYFDRYGYVMAVDAVIKEQVPIVEGVDLERIQLYEKLESAEGNIVEEVLQLTQLLSGYQIAADSILYAGDGTATVVLGDIRVSMGSSDSMAGKVSELSDIIASGTLQGLKGTLHLESYGSGSSGSSFIFDRE